VLRLDVPGRLTLSLGAALTAGTLGILAAQGMGLTETLPTAEIATPAPQTWDEPVAHPSFGRTEEATPSSPVTDPPPAVFFPGSDPVPTVAPAPAPTPAADTAAAPTVKQGDPCPTEGANGLTAKGRPVTCSSGPGGGPTRWRRA
jgi:hypothetical protein